MKANLEKRLKELEAAAGPRLIATLADFVKWCAEDEFDENVEFSLQMQKFMDESSKRIDEENKLSDK